MLYSFFGRYSNFRGAAFFLAAIIICSVAIFSQHPQVSATHTIDDLVARWHFDEGLGTTTSDSSGHGHTGELIPEGAGPTWVSGISGSGLSFDGVDDLVFFGTGPTITGTGPFTVSAWVMTTDTRGRIIQQRDGGFNGQYVLSTQGPVGWVTFGDGSFAWAFFGAKRVNDGVFHCIAATRENSGEGRIYVDGVFDRSAMATPRTMQPFEVFVGGDGRNNADFLQGVIDEIQIYSRALTASEIQGLCTLPIANAGPDQIVEATSPSGASIILDGSGSSDQNGDPLMFEWSESGTLIASDSSSTVNLPLGLHTITLKVTDPYGNLGTDIIEISVVDTTPPSIAAPSDITVVQECGSSSTSVFIGTATASDLVDSAPVISSDAPSGGFPLGTTTVTWTATDFSGNSAAATQEVNVEYIYSDVLQPINSDGSSVFKFKSTVPVKFKLSCSSGESVTVANAYLFLAKISEAVVGSEMEADSTSAASTGNQFRYNSGSDEYVFNLGTKNLSAGGWQLRIALDDGTSKFVIISLKA